MQLKHRTLLDYVVGALYLFRLNSRMYRLDNVLRFLNYRSTNREVHDIARYLEAKGFIRAIYTFGGVHVQLTSLGQIYVEDNEEKILAPLETYLTEIGKSPKQTIPGPTEDEIKNPTPKEIDEERRPIFLILERIAKLYEDSLGVKAHDLIKDLNVLRAELEKIEPDKDIIANKLNVIASIELSRSLYQELVDLLNLDER